MRFNAKGWMKAYGANVSKWYSHHMKVNSKSRIKIRQK